jgi:hypothetical protein
MDKIRKLLEIQKVEEIFALGCEGHVLVEQLRCAHISPASVHNQHENFFGTALRIRQKMNN